MAEKKPADLKKIYPPDEFTGSGGHYIRGADGKRRLNMDNPVEKAKAEAAAKAKKGGAE